MSSEKVLGFYKKDGEYNPYSPKLFSFPSSVYKGNRYEIEESKLVPVRLCSESVSLRFLENEIREHLRILDKCDVDMEDPRVRLNLLLEAVRLQVLKSKGGK